MTVLSAANIALLNAYGTNLGRQSGITIGSRMKLLDTDGSYDGSAGSTTFKTGTGAVSLNGDVAVATGKTFTAGISLSAQAVENIVASLTATTDSSYLTGDDITYSSARGSSALKIVSTYSGIAGGFSNIYSFVTASGAQTTSGSGVIGIKGVVVNTAVMTDGNILGAQFIAKHAHATNAMASEAALIGLEAIAYISAAGAAGTAIGANVTMRNYGGAGTVHRGIQVVLDQAGGTKATEATGICVWNQAGTWDAVLRVTGAFTAFANFDDATTCFVAVSNAPTNICGQIVVVTAAGAPGYIPVYGTTGS